MSLRDEMAVDYGEMVEDDSTTMLFGDVPITGRKTASIPTAEQMMDAGYNPKANCDFFVLASSLGSTVLAERDQLVHNGITWTIKGIDDKKESIGFVYSLKRIA